MSPYPDGPLRYIIVGTGGWGRKWCQEFLPRLVGLGKAVCTAAVDTHIERLQNAQRYLGLSADHCHRDAEDAFRLHEADFVIICVPPAHHEGLVDLALKYNMHILSEKPISDTIEAACRILHKVERAGKKMAVTMNHRFDQDKQSLEAAIRSGAFGPLDYLVGRFTLDRWHPEDGQFRRQMHDPLLVEDAVQHFDIFRGLAGADAASVHALTWQPPWGDYAGDTQAFITMRMTNGVKCLWEGAKCNAIALNGWGEDYFRAECELATLELDHRWLSVLRPGVGTTRPFRQDLALLQQDVWRHEWLVEMFCDWLLGRRPDHPTTLQDHIQCAALLFAAVQSAHTNQTVDVQSFLASHLEAARASLVPQPV